MESVMKKRAIFITSFDKQRLEDLVTVATEFGDHDRHDLEVLATELARAKVVEATKVPADVVTMNTRVLLRDLDTNKEMEYTLVFPDEADISAGAISILAPIGTAILGFRVGNTIEWQVPSGTRHILIEKILYQPEASGHFDR